MSALDRSGPSLAAQLVVIDQLKQAEFSLLRVEQLIDRGEFDQWEGCAIEAEEARAAVTRLIARLSEVSG